MENINIISVRNSQKESRVWSLSGRVVVSDTDTDLALSYKYHFM